MPGGAVAIDVGGARIAERLGRGASAIDVGFRPPDRVAESEVAHLPLSSVSTSMTRGAKNILL